MAEMVADFFSDESVTQLQGHIDMLPFPLQEHIDMQLLTAQILSRSISIWYGIGEGPISLPRFGAGAYRYGGGTEVKGYRYGGSLRVFREKFWGPI